VVIKRRAKQHEGKAPHPSYMDLLKLPKTWSLLGAALLVEPRKGTLLRKETLPDPENHHLGRHTLWPFIDKEGFDGTRWITVAGDGKAPGSCKRRKGRL
jgi:hypothetical protein